MRWRRAGGASPPTPSLARTSTTSTWPRALTRPPAPTTRDATVPLAERRRENRGAAVPLRAYTRVPAAPGSPSAAASAASAVPGVAKWGTVRFKPPTEVPSAPPSAERMATQVGGLLAVGGSAPPPPKGRTQQAGAGGPLQAVGTTPSPPVARQVTAGVGVPAEAPLPVALRSGGTSGAAAPPPPSSAASLTPRPSKGRPNFPPT